MTEVIIDSNVKNEFEELRVGTFFVDCNQGLFILGNTGAICIGGGAYDIGEDFDLDDLAKPFLTLEKVTISY